MMRAGREQPRDFAWPLYVTQGPNRVPTQGKPLGRVSEEAKDEAKEMRPDGMPRGKPFQKGQSGNPGGTKRKKVRAAIKHLSASAISSLATGVQNGEQWAVTLWFHYYYGKPTERHELTGADGEKLSVSIEINRTVKEGE